jgi:filamentous hemagglutinin family protein
MAAHPTFHCDVVVWVGAISESLRLNLYTLPFTLCGLILTNSPVLAQITPDATLGTSVNGSTTQPCIGTCLITNGTRRGSNLFHSLQQFSLRNNTDQAGFVTSPAIQNVIVRVTGVGQPFISTINGTIFTLNEALTAISPANLFLINPNGIIFGPNARLNVGGSFTATTASAVEFGNQGIFRASNPNNSVPLLTVNPSAYWMNQLPTARIVNRSVVGNLGLRVPDGQGLTLLGGTVEMDGGRLNAWGGRVELAAVAGAGRVDILPNGSLNISPEVVRGTVTLTNQARVEVRLNGGGEIKITATDIRLSNSFLLAGLDTLGGRAISRAGDVRLDATGTISLQDLSVIFNAVDSGVTGNAGDIRIGAAVLQVTDGSQLSARISGQGNAGNVVINARDRVLFQGTSADGKFNSGAFSGVSKDATGQGGNVVIDTGSLEVRNGAQLISATQGQGDAGNVQITARDRVLFQAGSAFSSVAETGKGQGGNVVIDTGSLEVRNGAQLIAATQGEGDAGNVVVSARDRVLFQGASTAFSSVTETGKGQGGNVVIDTDSLEVRDGQLGASTFGQGDAGNVVISARNRVLFQGSSNAFSNVAETGKGQGGNVVIRTSSLEVRDGAQLISATRGQGDAGNVQISARDRVWLDGVDPADGRSSGIFTSNGQRLIDGSFLRGTGQGGGVHLMAAQLQVSNGAVIDARTANRQSGGNITLALNDLTLLGGGQILTTSEGNGTAGTITVNARNQVRMSGSDPAYANRLARQGNRVPPVSANSGLYVRSTSGGAAGTIEVNTPNLTIDQQGRINAESLSGNGGDIILTVPRLLLLRNGGQISTNAGTAQAGGNGGNITIRTPFIVGVRNENSDITANAFTGQGGNITIDTNAIYGLQFQPRLTPFSDITASSEFGLSGTVAINTLNIDPNRGLVALPLNLSDPSQRIAQDCKPGGTASSSSFVATGRGGIPLSPDESLESHAGNLQWVPLPKDENNSSHLNTERPKIPNPIVEAQGWIVRPDGTVVLVAELPIQYLRAAPVFCQPTTWLP